MNIIEAVRTFLTNEKWKYAEEQGWFKTGVRLEDGNGALVQIDTSSGGLVVFAALDQELPEDQNLLLITFANALNMAFPMGCLFLDTQEKMLVFRDSSMPGGDTMTDDIVAEHVYFSLDMIAGTVAVIDDLIHGRLSPDGAVAKMIASLGEE